ncbi:MAG: endonuclease III [Spirochaetales bacterium]|uniref:Endonuclease III n=1 Tax=Candidatus Thalassospirochaeta sargassi TaxID=3119039 RepID=A0AAJ1MKN4_9SPIO|nr:endonuclease III [Spirochaetales bacterium]
MKIIEIFNILDELADSEIIFLRYENNFQLLIGVILSAQTTDRQVNQVLPGLFRKYPTPKDLGAADIKAVSEIIRPLGFFNVKASNIIKTAAAVATEHGGEVPQDMNSLLKLAGVGRKSANVIRGACFNLPAIIVDTHFARTVNRLGLTAKQSPDRIETDLAGQVPADIQYRFSMLLNKLGRDFCHARKPDCDNCPVRLHCSMFMGR